MIVINNTIYTQKKGSVYVSFITTLYAVLYYNYMSYTGGISPEPFLCVPGEVAA